MTELREVLIDPLQRDSFGRLEVAAPIQTFDSKLEYSKEPLVWDERTAGGATTTHLPNESTVRLDVPATTVAKMERRSHRSIPYSPGKGHKAIMTGVMGPSATGIVSRMGLFNDEDGFFLERDSTTEYVVQRTSISGAASDANKHARSTWLDPLDGSGPSGKTVDFDFSQILAVDLQWLGVGLVRFFIDLDGEFILFHQISNANVRASVYTKTAVLPISYEISNDGTGAAASMKHICSTVQTGGNPTTVRVHNHAISNRGTVVTVGTNTPILVIRPQLTFLGKRNRIQTKVLRFAIQCFVKPVFYQVVWRGAATGGLWAPITNSSVEYNVAATTFTGGHVIDENVVAISGTGGNAAGSLAAGGIEQIFLVVGDFSALGDEMAILATDYSGGGGSPTAHASFAWEELR